jgi:simple sugar transport system permease protein
MNDLMIVAIFGSILLQATPLIIAVCGEVLTERVGVVNLSLDGSMLMSAMTGFVVGKETDNLMLGFAAAALVGATFALIVAFGSIQLKQSQFAIGFVLTLLGDDLSAFLGQNYTRVPGPVVPNYGIPVLKDIPVLGSVFFDQNPVVYFALLLVLGTWWWLNHTQYGLQLRAVGERPEAAFARGVKVNRTRYLYTLIGGALVGIAGASYSFSVKLYWSEGHTRGFGWIALAIVIFGGWSPVRGMIGALVFGATKALATVLQRTFPEVSVVAFNALPWLLMIVVLVLVGSDVSERIVALVPERFRPRLRGWLRVNAPQALGVMFGEK